MSDVQEAPAQTPWNQGAQAIEQPTMQQPATVAETRAQPVVEEAPVQVPLEAAVPAVPAVEQEVVESLAGTQTEAQPETVDHTHESILTGLMDELEGLVHMGKAEIEAIVRKARDLFESL